PKTVKPLSTKESNKTSRIAEALILFCAGFLIIVFTSTNTSTGGSLLILDRLSPEFAKINVIIALCAMAGLLIALLVTLLGRTSIGFLIGVIICISYGTLLNNYHEALAKLTPGGAATPPIPYTISISNSQVEGAELWVNGVLLGETPVQTTVEEFLKKVPYWPEPPEGYRDGTDEEHVYHYSPGGVSGYSIEQRWEQFKLPNIPDQYSDLRQLTSGKVYYARVKLNGLWGYFTGSSGGGSGGGYTYSAQRSFRVGFPDLQESLDRMLDYARLNDYQVGSDWFMEMETLGQAGMNAIYGAINNEPDMDKVLDGWASWKYGLDKVTDEKSAWKVLEKICDEADRQQFYATSSIAGRAVELLTNKIDPDRLVSKAINIIRNTGTFGWNSWMLNGKFQFGMSYGTKNSSAVADKVSGMWSGGRGQRIPISGYAVAHAIWMLDKSLDAKDDSHPNIVERKVVPNMIAWHYNQQQAFQAAVVLGGSSLERFLYRQDWREITSDFDEPLRMSFSGDFYNGRLYLLANIDSPFAQKFRMENKKLLFSLADKFDLMGIEYYNLPTSNPFRFLFIDKSLAMEYWPKFKVRTMTKIYDALKQQFYYLVYMEPLPTVEMYVDAWKGYSEDYSNFQEALRVLDNLPQEKHDQVIEAIEQSIREDVSQIKRFESLDVRNYLLREIKSNHWSRIRTAKDILTGLESNTGEYKPQAVADWLEHDMPDHPLIKMLADANEPALRLLVMGALRENPTPANREILKKLLNDSDEHVRVAAQQVEAELETIKKTVLDELVSEQNF
ncbi:MAG: HEAT repeat domain-containing protein, partial [Sedimentisphaerales bacterium]